MTKCSDQKPSSAPCNGFYGHPGGVSNLDHRCLEWGVRRSRPLPGTQWGGADFSSGSVPLDVLIRKLYVIRFCRMQRDLIKGALVAAAQGPWSSAVLMPASSSFILQVTGDDRMAEDQMTIMKFASSFDANFLFLQSSIGSIISD